MSGLPGDDEGPVVHDGESDDEEPVIISVGGGVYHRHFLWTETQTGNSYIFKFNIKTEHD